MNLKWYYTLLLVAGAVLITIGVCREMKPDEVSAPTAQANPTPTPTPAPTATPVTVTATTPNSINVLGPMGTVFMPGAYIGSLGTAQIFSFSQEKKDSHLGVIILPNFREGRCIVVGDNGIMPDFIYHVEKPEGFLPIVHPTMKDASGRKIVVFTKE